MDSKHPDQNRFGLTQEELERLVEWSERDLKRRAAAFAAHVKANGKAWSASLRCAFTGKPLPHLDHEPDEWTLEALTAVPRDGGDAVLAHFGYGSKHDDDGLWLIGISDEAMDDLIAKGLAVRINDIPPPGDGCVDKTKDPA